MKYKKYSDNKYRVHFMRYTEKLMDLMTVEKFIRYLENNARFDESDTMYLDGKIVDTKIYTLKESPVLSKEFIVTEDGRVFYSFSMLEQIELVD